MTHRIRCCWLVGVMMSVLACAGSRPGGGLSRVPSAQAPPSTDSQNRSLDQEVLDAPVMTVDEPGRVLEQAGRQYKIAREAADRKEIKVAKTAIDKALELMVAISEVEDSRLVMAKEDLLKQLSKLIIAIHEGRVGGGTKGVISFTFNSRVEREIKRFTGREKRALLGAYERSGLYRDAIQQELVARGLPEALLWLPVIESGFTPRAKSSAQAVGLWQFVMATGQRYGLKRDAWTDDRMDPHKATVAAVAHLSDLYDVLGDWLLAVAAYNCGEERVLRAINRQATYDFWQLDLPRETERYVPRFLAAASIFANPDQYGMTLPPQQSPYTFDERLVEKSIALADAARVIEVPHERLKTLNPALRSDVTPPTGYRLRVPGGLGETLLASLDAIPQAKLVPRTESRRYVVRRGDTLSRIAKKFGTTTVALKKANRLKKNKLRTGQSLEIPGLMDEEAPPAVAQASTPATSTTVAEQDGAPSKRSSPALPRSYTVRRGDTLSGIARRFGTTVTALKQTNRLNRTNRLVAGQVVSLPDPGTSEQIASAQPAFERPVPVSIPSDSLEHDLFLTTHEVKAGDTIWLVARQYGLTVAELMDLNGLKRGEMIQRGQSLRIAPEGSRTAYYTVGQGDTLYSISKAHAVPVRSLMEWNQLGSFDLKTGQRLKIVLSP